MSRIARPTAAILLVLATLTGAGCQHLISDAATRVRYAMLDALAELGATPGATVSFTVEPDQWPDGCSGKGYTLQLIPYRGGKAVAVGDVDVQCDGGRHYWTGFGSAAITLAQELKVTKGPGETVTVTLRRTEHGAEIIDLK